MKPRSFPSTQLLAAIPVAIELFVKGKATLGEASRIAGISAGETMELLACRGLHLCPFT